MAFEYLKVFTGRRFTLGYISPAVCEGDFSSTGTPFISLLPILVPGAPSGPVMSVNGSLFRFSWETVAGALCYSIYKAVDEMDPFGPYTLIAECITDTFIDLPDDGWYEVEPITRDGVGLRSDPIHTPPHGGGGGTDPTVEVVDLTTLNWLSDDGTIAGIFNSSRPGYFFNGASQDTRDTTTSAPITASQTLTTVTASAGFFAPSDVGRFLTFLSGEAAKIVAYVSDVEVTVSVSRSVTDTTFITQGHTLGGSFGEAKVANGTGILGINESTFGDGDENWVWFDTGAGEYRDLGSTNSGSVVGIDEAGFLLLSTSQGATANKALIYDPNTNTFTDQGTPLGGPATMDNQATPVMMNATHQIAMDGNYFVGPDLDPANQRVRAFRTLAGVFTDIHPAEQDNPTPEGSMSNCAAINAAGHIVGTYFAPADGFQRTFFNSGGASVSMTGFFGEVDLTTVTCLNDSDLVVGSADDGTGNFVPFKWTPLGGPAFLPLLPGTTAGHAKAVNNAGWIVGTMGSKGFLHRAGVTEDLLTLIAAIDPLWTVIFDAQFVNNNKQIAGFGIHSGVAKHYLLTLV